MQDDLRGTHPKVVEILGKQGQRLDHRVLADMDEAKQALVEAIATRPLVDVTATAP